jgi:hypothetical protein
MKIAIVADQQNRRPAPVSFDRLRPLTWCTAFALVDGVARP